MPDLSVKVDRNDSVVSKPSSHFSVTYRREGRTLVADDVMRKSDPNAEELILLVRAWKATFAKAQSLKGVLGPFLRGTMVRPPNPPVWKRAASPESKD